MRYGLPLWCCLTDKSKLAVLAHLEAQGVTEFEAPLPVWRPWSPYVLGIAHRVIPDGFDYDKFMRRPSNSPRRVT